MHPHWLEVCFLFSLTLVSPVLGFSAAIQAKGLERMNEIQKAKGAPDNPTSACDMYKLAYAPSRKQAPRDDIKRVSEKGQLGISDEFYPTRISYPKDLKGDEQYSADFFTSFDPKAGVIVCRSGIRDKTVADVCPLSRADIAWEYYKAAMVYDTSAQIGTIDPKEFHNLKSIVHMDITTGGNPVGTDSNAVFQEILQSATKPGEAGAVFATIDNLASDAFLAVMGLDTGATISAMLRFHNNEMGGKSLKSVSVLRDGQSYNAWFNLQ